MGWKKHTHTNTFWYKCISFYFICMCIKFYRYDYYYFCIFYQNNGICLCLSFAPIKWNLRVPNPPHIKMCTWYNSVSYTTIHSQFELVELYFVPHHFKVISTSMYCTQFYVILWWWFNVPIFETNGYQLLGAELRVSMRLYEKVVDTHEVQKVKIVFG